MVAKGYRTCRTTWSNDKRMSLPNLMTNGNASVDESQTESNFSAGLVVKSRRK